MKNLLYIFSALAFVLTFSGCVLLAPLINAFKSTGIRASDREELLKEPLTRFHIALQWDPAHVSLKYASSDARDKIAPDIKRRKKEEKIVEVKVNDIEFSDLSTTATVYVTEKYYRIPFYTVTERETVEVWNYSIGGWELIEFKAADNENSP